MTEPKTSMQHLENIIDPVFDQVAVASLKGIAFVVHNPDIVARKAIRNTGQYVKRGATTVYGLTCERAAKVWGTDFVTRKFLSTPPGEDQIKIFLVAGGGSALLTLHFVDGQVFITKESDMHIT